MKPKAEHENHQYLKIKRQLKLKYHTGKNKLELNGLGNGLLKASQRAAVV